MAYLKKTVRTQHRTYIQRVKCWCYNHASIRGKRRVRKFATSERKAWRNKRAAHNKGQDETEKTHKEVMNSLRQQLYNWGLLDNSYMEQG